MEKEKLKEIKNKALQHYDKMIAWARQQDLDEIMDSGKMLFAIGEEWYNNDCSYCKSYGMTCAKCISCPLNMAVGCCDGLWDILNMSTTWGDWVIHAIKVREYIRGNG